MPESNSGITIRAAVPGDLETVVGFNRAMALETEGKTLDPVTLRGGVGEVLQREDLGFYLLAELGGTVVGQLMITYEWSDWRDGFFWWIQSVFVRPKSRRRGVYRALAEHVTGLAKAHGGVRGVRLYVDRDNAGAQAVYRRMGMSRSNYDLYELELTALPKKSPVDGAGPISYLGAKGSPKS